QRRCGGRGRDAGSLPGWGWTALPILQPRLPGGGRLAGGSRRGRRAHRHDVHPGRMDGNGRRHGQPHPSEVPDMNPVSLSIIGHAFAATAEEMGVNLYRSAHSTIVREVRDMATALMDADGNT